MLSVIQVVTTLTSRTRLVDVKLTVSSITSHRKTLKNMPPEKKNWLVPYHTQPDSPGLTPTVGDPPDRKEKNLFFPMKMKAFFTFYEQNHCIIKKHFSFGENAI